MQSLHARRLSQLAQEVDAIAPGLAARVLGWLWVSRPGLGEADIMSLLMGAEFGEGPLATDVLAAGMAQLKQGSSGVLSENGQALTLADDAVREAVKELFLPDQDAEDDLRLEFADWLEKQPVTTESTSELYWQLKHSEACARLKQLLLDIPRFSSLFGKDPQQIWDLWNWLGDDGTVGAAYVDGFFAWADTRPEPPLLAKAANELSFFLHHIEKKEESERLLSGAVKRIEEQRGSDHPDLASTLNNLAVLYLSSGRIVEAEPLAKRVAQILVGFSAQAKKAHPYAGPALNNYAAVLQGMGLQPPQVIERINALLSPFGAQVSVEAPAPQGDGQKSES